MHAGQGQVLGRYTSGSYSQASNSPLRATPFRCRGPGRPWLAFQRTIFRASSLPDHPQGADTHIQPGLAELEREGKNRDELVAGEICPAVEAGR